MVLRRCSGDHDLRECFRQAGPIAGMIGVICAWGAWRGFCLRRLNLRVCVHGRPGMLGDEGVALRFEEHVR